MRGSKAPGIGFVGYEPKLRPKQRLGCAYSVRLPQFEDGSSRQSWQVSPKLDKSQDLLQSIVLGEQILSHPLLVLSLCPFNNPALTKHHTTAMSPSKPLPEGPGHVKLTLLDGGSFIAHTAVLHDAAPADDTFRMYIWAFHVYHPSSDTHAVFDLGISSVNLHFLSPFVPHSLLLLFYICLFASPLQGFMPGL